jgi:hypothetical protein
MKNNKDIKAFQIKIDEQTHRIQISQLADDTTPKMRYLLLPYEYNIAVLKCDS